MNQPFITIGGASKETVVEARAAILDIMNAPVGESVKKRALDTLRYLVEGPKHVAISSNTFQADGDVHNYPTEEGGD